MKQVAEQQAVAPSSVLQQHQSCDAAQPPKNSGSSGTCSTPSGRLHAKAGPTNWGKGWGAFNHSMHSLLHRCTPCAVGNVQNRCR